MLQASVMSILIQSMPVASIVLAAAPDTAADTASYSSSDLHISKSGGNVLLYLGNNVISRTCSIGVTSVSQSGPNSYRITVRIDGDTDFYLTY